jgi:23S rRNA (cytidine1920-2'-O)/16S rRNA (cytidine1409-2'-O)-methyltransferase
VASTSNAPSKLRLDQLLVDRQLVASKTKAQAVIMAGSVTVEGRVCDKPGTMVAATANVGLIAASPYVSRGGEKLASVAAELKLDFTNKVVLDVGASTGGFTDYALQQGASQVITVDVGTGQLDWRLRNDPRVQVHEQTDIRHFESDIKADIALVDVSFVSILKVIDDVAKLVKPEGSIVAMIKPQFEAGKAVADKYHGIINDEPVRQSILADVTSRLTEDYEIVDAADSKVPGPKGNLEHFVLLKPKR